MKTSELKGAALDWAVAKCEDILHPWGYIRIQDGRVMWITPRDHETADQWHQYSPSTDWAQGGPIIECENIELSPPFTSVDGLEFPTWCATIKDKASQMAYTALGAAMRCFVASRLGDDVDIPEELV